MHPSDDTKEACFFTPGICCLGGRPSCAVWCKSSGNSYSASHRGAWNTLRLCTFNPLNPNGYYTYHQVSHKNWIFSYDCRNRQLLFRYTAFAFCPCKWKHAFSVSYELNLMCNVDSFWCSCQLDQVSVDVLGPRANAELLFRIHVALHASYVALPKINICNFRQNTALRTRSTSGYIVAVLV
jgi:hypothetical protein